MKMKTIKTEKCLCVCCMEEHNVKTVAVRERLSFKGITVSYDAQYMYCDNADELYANEKQMQENDISLKNAYRGAMGLLTREEIIDIRNKYGITQTDLCKLLGWGGKTISRYEGHQVQDKAHDMILRKLDQDPEWFLYLLNDQKNCISEESRQRCIEAVSRIYETNRDSNPWSILRTRIKDVQALMKSMKLSLEQALDALMIMDSERIIISDHIQQNSK